MKTLLFLILLTIPVNALDFKITVEDKDAIDAMNNIIVANGSTQTPEQYLSEFITLRHAEMREGQLRNAAQAKAEQDPDLIAFLKAKADKAAILSAQEILQLSR